MTLVETGTRALLGAVFGPPATGETDYARQLLHLLDAGHAGADRPRLRRRRRSWTRSPPPAPQFLARLRSTRRLPVLARLDDGSFLSRIGELTVRIITADITVTCADGTRYTAATGWPPPCSITAATPPPALIPLYHERWEHEIAYLALRHTLAARPGAALDRPSRARTGNVGAAGPLPGAAPGHGHRRRIRPRHRPGPGQLHHRPANRHRPLIQRRRHHHRPHRPRPAASAAPSWTTCSRPDAPAPASARSNPRFALQQEDPTGPNAAPRSPA